MTDARTRATLAQFDGQRLVPCTITQVSPLLVSMNGAANIPGERITGCDYAISSTANAFAFLNSPGKPLILPIG